MIMNQVTSHENEKSLIDNLRDVISYLKVKNFVLDRVKQWNNELKGSPRRKLFIVATPNE